MEENQNFVGSEETQNGHFEQQNYHKQQNQYQMQKPSRPDTYLLWAILTTCFCCVPLGIYAIIRSSKVENLYAMGDYEGAYKASDDAKKWSIISAVLGLIAGVIYFLILLMTNLLSSSGYDYMSI